MASIKTSITSLVLDESHRDCTRQRVINARATLATDQLADSRQAQDGLLSEQLGACRTGKT